MSALFLDRDGVINPMLYYPDWNEYEAPRTPDEYSLLPNVLESLTRLQAAGWQLFLISNQPGHAKGKFPMQAQFDVHARLVELLAPANIEFSEYYYSYTHPKGVVPEYTGESPFRKPNPGFLLQAQSDYDLDLSQCWMVGDCDTDVECGKRVGCHTALITYPHTAYKRTDNALNPDLTCTDLADFVHQLMTPRRNTP
jgi:D-glycero-D-manno-heptose 1,7-bisphosphate phosphatase